MEKIQSIDLPSFLERQGKKATYRPIMLKATETRETNLKRCCVGCLFVDHSLIDRLQLNY